MFKSNDEMVQADENNGMVTDDYSRLSFANNTFIPNSKSKKTSKNRKYTNSIIKGAVR